MKLNVRTVIRYALGSAPWDRQGFLLKKGELNPSYQRRWFTLCGNLLFYSERPGEEAAPQGLVLLEGCGVELCQSSAEGYPFSLQAGGGLRQYKLVAECQEDQEAWVRAISSASLGYIRPLVAELQTRYRELVGAGDVDHLPSPSPSAPSSPLPQPRPPDTFLSLHRRYGEGVERARGEWRRRRASASRPGPEGVVIDLD